MDRRRALSVALAVLAVLALSAAAATLNTTKRSGSGFGLGEGEGSGAGDSQNSDFGAPNTSQIDDGPAGGSLPFGLLVLAVLALASLVSLYLLYREHGARGAAGVLVVVTILAVLLYLLVSAFQGLASEFDGEFGIFGERAPTLGGGGAPGAASDAANVATEPPVVLLVLLGLVVLGAVAVAMRSTGDDERQLDVAAGDDAPDVAAVGRAAGRAADRIAGDADATNEVYRAWREMTDHLEVADPASSTPAEFAAAAVDAGMARDDVEELTGLFEEVRYGDAPATDDRERRAVAALRRIEDEYADP